MGKRQRQVSPHPTFPFTKGPELKPTCLPTKWCSCYRYLLTPHMVFKLELVANRRNKFAVVLTSVSKSWKFIFMGVRYSRLSRSVTTGVTLTWSGDLWPNEPGSYFPLNTIRTDRSIKWTTFNSWTACKSKSSFLSFEAEFSAIISFKTCVFVLTTSLHALKCQVSGIC